MIRVNIVVEGQTEENFINSVVAPEFYAEQIFFVPSALQTGRRKGVIYRGGAVKYQRLKVELQRWRGQDPSAILTTMLDLYGLSADFPGHAHASTGEDPVGRAKRIEHAMREDVDVPPFVPYIQVHEFEALLFSEPEAFLVEFPGSVTQAGRLSKIAEQFQSPEHIDDGPETAPSKRILEVFPAFKKTVQGANIARRIGLARLRTQCQHLGEWLQALERSG